MGSVSWVVSHNEDWSHSVRSKTHIVGGTQTLCGIDIPYHKPHDVSWVSDVTCRRCKKVREKMEKAG